MKLFDLTSRIGLCAASFILSVATIKAGETQAPAPVSDQKEENSPAWKLTSGWYHFSNSTNAGDFNLRYTWKDVGNLWAGYYIPQHPDPDQWRGGWDSQFDLGLIRIMPSLQVASGDFFGGSFGIETGKSWFIGAGYGRTNLRPYVNLNFDPNDSYTVNAGYRWENGASASVLWVQDVRLNPDEKHLHLVYRTPLPKGQRLTLDVLFKTGLVEDSTIHRVGATVTYDWPRFFLRLAYDPKANFGNEDMWRFSVGTRF